MIQYGRVNFLKFPFENWISLKKLGKEIDLSHSMDVFNTVKPSDEKCPNKAYKYDKMQEHNISYIKWIYCNCFKKLAVEIQSTTVTTTKYQEEIFANGPLINNFTISLVMPLIKN